ncbi:hypothetical protein Smlt0370 [Stenotrophomonas maltophilia K279a]|uniref:Uncharacterized protein n=1 Tax=Stenotrophomonas maltophilia (strain K279a) TaxID=522373 RepID=B2FJ41_STRMK|nr:hypothetical protein Smlt0370 [Stenotrophomonas maltophilia K279a]
MFPRLRRGVTFFARKESNQRNAPPAASRRASHAGTLRSSARRGTARELAALRHPHLFALAGPAVLSSLKADWKVKINGKSIHAWRGSYLLPIWHLGCREPGVGDRVDPGLATEK